MGWTGISSVWLSWAIHGSAGILAGLLSLSCTQLGWAGIGLAWLIWALLDSPDVFLTGLLLAELYQAKVAGIGAERILMGSSGLGLFRPR